MILTKATCVGNVIPALARRSTSCLGSMSVLSSWPAVEKQKQKRKKLSPELGVEPLWWKRALRKHAQS